MPTSLNDREVTFACLHAHIFVPSNVPGQMGQIGQIGPTLVKGPPDSKLGDLRMYLGDNFLHMTCKGYEIAIPLTNVTHVILK